MIEKHLKGLPPGKDVNNKDKTFIINAAVEFLNKQARESKSRPALKLARLSASRDYLVKTFKQIKNSHITLECDGDKNVPVLHIVFN